jgi:hypothetical protein
MLKNFLLYHRLEAIGGYRIFVDGLEAGTLRSGDSLKCDVLPGDHLVEARVSGTQVPGGELVIRCDPGSSTRVRCMSIYRPWNPLALGGYVFGSRKKKITVELTEDPGDVHDQS